MQRHGLVPAYWRWFIVKPRIVWFTTVVLMGTFAWCVLWQSEAHIRWAGGFLQLLGLMAVARGIHDTRRLFGLPTLWEKAGEWFSSMPGKSRTVSISGSASLGVTGSARGYSTSKVGPDASIEERLGALERNFESVQLQINQAYRDVDKKHQEAKSLVDAERRERKAETSETKTRLESFATGGIYLSMMGTVWIIAGTILSTTSVELHGFLEH